jgi:ABC-2 type transport system ATP-binding protein
VAKAQQSLSAVSVKNLTKKYGDFLAVNDITFEVPRGEIFAFLGPNGAGKTTTIKMLTTLLQQTSGEIEVYGFNTLKNQDDVRKSFGIVFQDPSLDEELTAYENMEFHGVLYNIEAKLRRQRTEELLNIVELWDRKDAIVKTFSGGMRRRLEIARGLLHHPKIFFLDEPTVGLDPQTRNQIWKYIQNLNQKENITVFFTTHYMEEAERFSQRIAIIDQGKILIQGTSQELMKKTKQKTLEDAFLELTGRQIREEEASAVDHLRMHSKMWRGRSRR